LTLFKAKAQNPSFNTVTAFILQKKKQLKNYLLKKSFYLFINAKLTQEIEEILLVKNLCFILKTIKMNFHDDHIAEKKIVNRTHLLIGNQTQKSY
jgi:hypothetical protein